MASKHVSEPDPRRTTPGPDGEVQSERDTISARKHQKEQQQFVENEGLVKRKGRGASDASGSVEGEDLANAREAAAQRGRSAN